MPDAGPRRDGQQEDVQPDQPQVDDPQADQPGEDLGRRVGADALADGQQAVDHERLAAHLGDDPAEEVGDPGQRQQQHEHPQVPAGVVEALAPAHPQEQAGEGRGEQQAADRHHQPERPVDPGDGRDVGLVCAVEPLVLDVELVEPAVLPLQAVVGQYRAEVGDLEAEAVLPAVLWRLAGFLLAALPLILLRRQL